MPNRWKKYLPLVWVAFMLASLTQVCAAQTVGEMLSQADDLFKHGKTEEARKVYESIVQQDTSCLEAAVWLGNYYFLKGEEKRKEAERSYTALPYPSSMQSAYYREQLKTICRDYHLKAETLVQRALRGQPNDHLQSIAAGIEAFKIKLGLAKAPVKKKPPILKLLRSKRDSARLQ